VYGEQLFSAKLFFPGSVAGACGAEEVIQKIYNEAAQSPEKSLGRTP